MSIKRLINEDIMCYVHGKPELYIKLTSVVFDGTGLFGVHVTVHHVKFLIIKPTRCTNFSYLFLE